MLPRTLFALVLTASLASAQVADQLAVAVPYDLSSGVLSHNQTGIQSVWVDTISVPGASALQVVFETAELGSDEDAIVLTSAFDGQTQRLGRIQIKQWRNHSAWFNGPGVAIRVDLAQGSTAQVVVDRVYAGITPPPGIDTLCGVDDRALSSDSRVCRLMTSNTTTGGGCTGWLISDTSTFLSAGHCTDPIPSYFVVAEFNVPMSASNGAVNHPPVADQYPVDQSTIQFHNNAIGDDWGIGRLHPNSSGGTAASNQGWFQLAGSLPVLLPPFIVPTFRVTGYGSDNTPNLTYEYVQQTSTGPAWAYSGNTLQYRVDTEGGNSGSPIIDTATGYAVGIHTNGGCSSSSSSYNSGTSLFNASLQSAISNVTGCAAVGLVAGAPVVLPCTPSVFNIAPASSRWVGVAVSSPSDWDVQIENNYSSYGGNTCDFLIANGNNGTVAPVSGRMYRFSGSDVATGDFENAVSMTLGNTYYTSWSSNRILRLFEFNVTAAGIYDITVTGASALGWRLYAPGTDANWHPRSSVVVAAGTVGGSTASNVALSTGWHVIAVYKDGGPAAVSPSTLSLTVCTATTSMSLALNTPATITNPCQDFTIAPSAGTWNVVGISSTSDWDLALGAAISYTGGADFAIANGHNGVLSPSWGQFVRFSGSADATAEHRVASYLTVGPSSLVTIPAGGILHLLEFFVPAAGTYDVTLTGDPSLVWRVYDAGSDSLWHPEVDYVGSGSVGGSTVTVALNAGYAALLLSSDYGPSTSARTALVQVCGAAAPIALSANIPSTVPGPCRPFTFTPEASRWNAVGVTSVQTSDWDLGLGNTYSWNNNPATDFVVANGHLGTISPTNGIATRYSGGDDGTLQRSFNVTLGLGSSYGANWPTNYVVRMFEFEVVTPGSYDLTLSGSTELGWQLFEPGTDASYRPRGTAANYGTANGVTLTRNFSAGWHGIAVYHDNGPAAATIPFQVLWAVTPNPAPSLTAISPSVATAGGAAFTLTVNGANFIGSSEVRWNGSPLPTTLVNSGQLTATVAASLIASAGTATVTVFTPAPGGGTTSGLTITINNPVPTLTGIGPTSATAGGAAFTLTLTGTGYNATSQPRWNGSALPVVSQTATSIQATVAAALIATAGPASVTVFNPSPGGGTSSGQTFTINNPLPVLSSISPTSATAGGAAFTLTLNGSAFNNLTEARWNGSALPIVSRTATQIQATVAAALITAPGTASVTAFNPTPGGGTSVARTFTINYPAPTLTSLAPSSAVAGVAALTMNVNGANFYTGASVVRWNGANLPTTFVSGTQLSATVSAVLLSAPGSATVQVFNPTPGGGLSASLTFTILAPTVTSVAPASIGVLTPASAPVTLTVTGTNFLPGTVAYANSSALPTTVLNATTLTCSLGPTVPQTQRRGGVAVAVENSHRAWSNSRAVRIGAGGSNQGTIVRHPLNPLPGEPFAVYLESGYPSAPFTLIVDATNPMPIYPFPAAAHDFVLNVRPLAIGAPNWIVFDGIGIYGPPTGLALNASGIFNFGGFTAPSPAVGITFTLQGAFLDPTSLYGYRIQWGRWPDSW